MTQVKGVLRMKKVELNDKLRGKMGRRSLIEGSF